MSITVHVTFPNKEDDADISHDEYLKICERLQQAGDRVTHIESEKDTDVRMHYESQDKKIHAIISGANATILRKVADAIGE